MRIRVSGIFLFVCITTCLSLAIDRPQTPTIDDVDFDGQTITIWGSKDDGDSCHAVLITDLTVPFQYGNDISRSELGSDGAAINWAQENFPMNIKIGNKSIERYYIAVAVSDIIDGKRVFSPWRLYCDSLLGLPVSISTSHDSISETFFRRGRFIDENNGSKLVLDLTFSLATSKASSCKLKLKKNSSVILDIDNLASISGSKTDINDAIQNTSGIDNSLIFKRESNGFYLYNIYQMVDYNSSDTFSATLINSDGSLLDTTTNRISAFSDSSYKNIISTISALVRMPDGTSDPFYPSSIPPHSDSVKIDLLLTAMLDLSLAHNSPIPKGNEVSQGIFNNYMQFMDNVAGNWESLKTVGRGISRLKSIHNLVLGQNKGEIKDPVSVINHGTSFERITHQHEQKRNNYAFYDGYARINWEVTKPDYGVSQKSGLGIMFRISENVSLFGAEIEDGLVAFDTLSFLNGEDNQRIIYRADDTLVNKFIDINKGLWLKGIEKDDGKKEFYAGIEPVRLPVAGLGCYSKIDTAFSLPNEEKGKEDPEGNFVDGAERSILKIYGIENDLDNVNVIENTDEGNLFLHGQKRKVVFDKSFLKPGSSVSFRIVGDEEYRDKIVLESVTDSSVILHDTSVIPTGKINILAVFYANAIPAGAFIKQSSSHKLILRDAYDGNLVLDTYIPKKYKDKYLTDLELVPFNVETDSVSWPPPEDRKDLKVKIRWNKGVSLYDYNKLQMLPSEENVFGSDAKLRKRHLYFDKWLPFKNNFLVNPRLYLAKESPGKSKISFSCNTGSFFKPEILKERIYINGYRVKFTEHEDQLNGFDQVESSDIDYISVNGDFGETKVYVEIEPFETGKFWAISSDPTLITINGESCKEITSEKMELQINVVDGTPTPERKCYVWIRAGSLVRGTMLKELNVMIYKQKNVDKIYFERVTDLSSPKTHISDIVSSTDILNDLNNYYKQAVVYVGDIIGKENDTCAVNFDLNGNGALDYYYDGANPEFDRIKTRFQTGQVKVVQVNNFREVWRVDPTVSSVSKTSHVKLEGVSYLETSSTDCYYFGKQGDVFEKVYVIKVNDITNVITFKTPLVNSYDNSDGKIELFGSLGGLSAEPIIVTKGNRLPFVIGHELLHKTLFGHLLDVSEEDNLMYCRVKDNNIGKLRYRKQTYYYKKDIGKSGFDQWSDINRTDIVGGE